MFITMMLARLHSVTYVYSLPHTHTHTHTHTYIHTQTHTYTHSLSLFPSLSLCPSVSLSLSSPLFPPPPLSLFSLSSLSRSLSDEEFKKLHGDYAMIKYPRYNWWAIPSEKIFRLDKDNLV